VLCRAQRAEYEGADAQMVEESGRLPALDKVSEEEADGGKPPAEVCCMEVERDCGFGCRKLGLQEHAKDASDDGQSNEAKLCPEGAALAEDGELKAPLLDDEVEDPVQSLAEPPASGSSLVCDCVVLHGDKVVESVENVLLSGDDSLDDECKARDDGEGELTDIDEAESEILVCGLPVALEHGTAEKEHEALAEHEQNSDDGQTTAVDDVLGDVIANHHNGRNRHPVGNVREYS